MISKPMLAAVVTDEKLEEIEFPVLLSPKIDGIRCLLHPELGPVTRSFKPLPNELTRDALIRIARDTYLDGELIALNSKCERLSFNETQSALMSRGGRPDFLFYAFDCFRKPSADFMERHYDAEVIINELNSMHFRLVPHTLVGNIEAFRERTEMYVRQGYEGVCLRHRYGPYKSGRSTFRQGWLLKYKQWQDAEGTIIGFEELLRNTNEDVKDNFGYAKRSHAKSGMVPAGTLGALVLETQWGELRVGSGFDASLRDQIWRRNTPVDQNGERILDHAECGIELPDIGRVVTFKYQAYGMQDKPRFPIFKGFREE